MSCHFSVSCDEVSRKAGQRGVPDAELKVGWQCANVARKMRSNGVEHGRRDAGPARDLVEQRGQSGRRLVGITKERTPEECGLRLTLRSIQETRWKQLLIGNSNQRWRQ